MNRNFLTAFRKAYPLVYRPVWKENLLLSFVDIFHGLSFAAVVILTQRFFDSIAGGVEGEVSRNAVILAAASLIACQVVSQLLNGFVNFYADVVREKGYGRIRAMLQEKISRLRPVDFEKNSFLTDLVKMRFGDRIERQIAPARREAEAYEQTLTTLENYRETRVLGAARYFLRLYREAVGKWNRTAWKYRKKEAAISLGLNCFSFLSYGGILLLLVSGCVRGQISVGAFAAVFSSIDVMFLLMEEIFQDSLGCLSQNMGRVNNFLNLMESPESRQESVEMENGRLTLDDVSFRYPEAEKDCLQHISLEIADGETVAVVGEKGAGKTTLARILLGIYPPDSGSVTLGGKVMDEKTNCFPSISAVFQKFNRYKLTLEENIRISDLPSKRRWEDALGMVDSGWKNDFHADAQTVLTRDFDGVDLSGGQWQKVAIARGIYRESKLLLLDEPTSSIDPIQESRLYQTFLRAAEGRTCIIITHRLGLAKIADRVIVLKEGRVVENGSHKELLEQKGEYSRMWEAQAGWYQSGMAENG